MFCESNLDSPIISVFRSLGLPLSPPTPLSSSGLWRFLTGLPTSQLVSFRFIQPPRGTPSSCPRTWKQEQLHPLRKAVGALYEKKQPGNTTSKQCFAKVKENLRPGTSQYIPRCKKRVYAMRLSSPDHSCWSDFRLINLRLSSSCGGFISPCKQVNLDSWAHLTPINFND